MTLLTQKLRGIGDRLSIAAMGTVTAFLLSGPLCLAGESSPIKGATFTPDPEVAAGPASGERGIILATGRLGLMQNAQSFQGRKLIDAKERTVGTVQDFVVDLASGRVLAGCVSPKSGGLVALPPSLFAIVRHDRLQLSIDRAAVDAAPRINGGGMDGASLVSAVERSANAFRCAAPAVSGGDVTLASRVANCQVRAENDVRLGKVLQVLLDLQMGTIIYVTVEPEKAAPGEDAFYPLPPVVLRRASSGGCLVMNGDAQRFLAGPSVQREFPTDMALPQFALKAYRYYGLEANEAPGSRSFGHAAVATAAQPENTKTASDQDISNAVMRALLERSGAASPLEVSVVTTHGKTTLSGNVPNERLRRTIVAVAESIVGAGNVDDRLNDKPRGLAVTR